MEDPNVIAEKLKRAGQISEEEADKARAVFDADIAKCTGVKARMPELIIMLRVGLTYERLHNKHLRRMLEGQRKSHEVELEILAQKDRIIELLAEHCRVHSVDLPKDFRRISRPN